MSSSILTHKFLVDENVHRKLYKFLNDHGYNVKLASNSATDAELAAISKKENRILITNDEDFIYYTGNQIHSVVWLKISQGDVKTLLESFDQLIKNVENFSGRLIILRANKWDDLPLGKNIML